MPENRKPTNRKATQPADKPPARVNDAPGKGRRTQVRVRRHRQGDQWELVHPRDAVERSEDLEEVRQMIDAGETELAVDELRWLLSDCRDFIEAHRLLAELALEAGDMALARAHFGFAYDLGLWALPAKGLDGPLPYRLPTNQAFLEAAKGLAYCLRELDQTEQALKVIAKLLECDDSDPLGVRGWLEAWRANSKPG